MEQEIQVPGELVNATPVEIIGGFNEATRREWEEGMARIKASERRADELAPTIIIRHTGRLAITG